MDDKWNLKKQMLEEIKNKGGFVNCHNHFDKAFYINKISIFQNSYNFILAININI